MTRPTLVGIVVGCLVLFASLTGCGPVENREAAVSAQAAKSGIGNRCGDGICGPKESCSSCPQDCGQCPVSAYCGDGACNGGETCSTCPRDCGACPPTCGDGVCNGTETCSTCPSDCGACPPTCGDGTCTAGLENCSTCPQDCGTCPSCSTDADCIPDSTCHPAACMPSSQTPVGGGACDADCRSCTLDCGQGYCACQNGQCTAVITSGCP